MAKITYDDKEALIENPSIPDINKVKADDMNEIKEVVNENDDKFLTNGVNVGTEVDEDYKVNFLKSKNLFDKNNTLPNSRLDGSGNVITDTGYYCSQFIKVKPNTKYTFSANESIVFTYCTYDSDKSFITRYYPSGTSVTITTNSNVEYIRTQSPNANLNYFQLEEGDTATTYEPYIDKVITLDGATIYNEALQNYSTGEKIIGKWIDGSTLYRKVVDFGALPNATEKTVAHNIADIDFIVNVKGISYDNYSFFPLPFSYSGNYFIALYANKTNIIVNCGTNRTNYATTYVILEYTKTTD